METPAVNLRPFSEKDIDALVKYANNAQIANNLTDAFPHPYGESNAKAFINSLINHQPTRVFAIDIAGEACGAIGVFPQTDIHRKNAEMGYWLAEPYWGMGLMTQVVHQMIDYAFNTFDIDRIFARPFGSNLASQRVLEKNGMVLEARFKKVLLKNNQYEDELIFAIRRSPKSPKK